MLTVDWTLKIGDLLTILLLCLGGFSGAVAYLRAETKKDVKLQESEQRKADRDKAYGERLAAVEVEMKTQTRILERLAAGDERMKGIEHRLNLIEVSARH